MVDIHSHILPGLDDGAASFDESLAMLRMAAEQGTTDIVATPHANNEYKFQPEIIGERIAELAQAVEGAIRIHCGCDFHLSYENVQDALLRPDWYCIEGGRYLLVEFSNFSIPSQVEEYFTKLGDQEIRPIITHPERNPILQQDPQRVLKWVELGCAVQVTASAMTGYWGERVWRIANWLLERDAVHFLATDAHDTKHRVPILSTARKEVAEMVGADIAKALVDDNPRAVITGQPLPYFPDPVMRG